MKTRTMMGILSALAMVACAEDDQVIAPPGPLEGTLALEIRDQAQVKIEGMGDRPTISIQISKGFGVAPEGLMLTAQGFIEEFPEAKMKLYTARFDPQPVDNSRCGAEPVALALSLHQKEGARVSGSLAVYCGTAIDGGEPIRILRLSGELRSK